MGTYADVVILNSISKISFQRRAREERREMWVTGVGCK